MMTQNEKSIREGRVTEEGAGFVKREKTVCPECGKKIFKDAMRFHKVAKHP